MVEKLIFIYKKIIIQRIQANTFGMDHESMSLRVSHHILKGTCIQFIRVGREIFFIIHYEPIFDKYCMI